MYQNNPSDGQHRTVNWFFALAVLALFAGAPGSAWADDEVQIRVRVPSTSKRTCGAETLYFCLRTRLRDSPTLAALEKSLPIGYEGVSAGQIVRLVDSLGMPMQGLRVSLRELGASNSPSILHVNDNHFVAFVRMENDRIVIFDNTIGLLDCVPEWFHKAYHWKGEALIPMPANTKYLGWLQSKAAVLCSAGLFLVSCGIVLAGRKPAEPLANATMKA